MNWIILRTSGRSTLRLAESLKEDGFTAWTPSEMKRNRRPRTVRMEPEPAPIMPTFVFAGSEHLVDLIDISEAPLRRGSGRQEPAHPEFSVFHHYDRIPLVSDASLAPLRAEEARLAAKERKVLAKGISDPFCPGNVLKIPDGAFAGMSGQVVESNGKVTLICFGRMEVEFSTFILRSDMANGLQAATGSRRAA